MACLKDVNIVGLLGVCYQEEPLYAVFEYMKHGDLRQFLQARVAAESSLGRTMTATSHRKTLRCRRVAVFNLLTCSSLLFYCCCTLSICCFNWLSFACCQFIVFFSNICRFSVVVGLVVFFCSGSQTLIGNLPFLATCLVIVFFVRIICFIFLFTSK